VTIKMKTKVIPKMIPKVTPKMTIKVTPKQIKEEIKEKIEISIKGLNQAIADGKAFKKIFYNTDFIYDDARFSFVSKTVEITFRNSFTGDMTTVVSAYIGRAIDGVCDHWEFYIYDSYIRIEGFNEGFNEGFDEGFNEGFDEGFNEGFNKGFYIPASDIEELLGVSFKDLV